MGTKITWYGHATMGFETNGQRVLIDPFFTGNPAAAVNADSVAADYVIVTHGHHDHVGDTIAICNRTGATAITNAEISRWLKQKGVQNTHAQHLGGGFHYPFGYLKFTLALHGSGLPDGTCGGNPVGLLLTTKDDKKIYFAGDTGLFGDMRLIGEEGIDLAFLPIGDNFTMGPSDALRAVKMIQPKKVIPIHFNTWDLIAQDAQAWVNLVNKETDSKAELLKPGDHVIV